MRRVETLAIAAWIVAAQAAGCGGGDREGTTEGTPAGGVVAGEGAATMPTEESAGEAATTTVSGAAAPAASGAAIQTQEVDAEPGLLAEITEVSRKEGVLTVKVRFRNTGSEQVYHSFETGHGDYSLFYVTAGAQKYFILKDTEGAPLAPKYLTVNLDPERTMTWWAKFPAPPAGETSIDLIVPDIPPFEDVAIADR
jgi:hypothetical protein